MNITTTMLTLTLMIGQTTWAAPKQNKPVNENKPQAAEMTLKLDTTASKAVWTGKKLKEAHTGTVGFKDGMFLAKGGMLSGGEITIDLTQIANEDVKDPEWNKKLVDHLKGEDFFNVAQYPTATFKIKKFTEQHNFAPGSPNAIAKGDLTIRGKTQPAEVKLFYTANENGFEAKGKLTFDRTKFDVKYNSKKFFSVAKLGDKLIQDQVDVDLTIVAKKN